MAYKDSGEIANNSNYALGDYSFRIERTSVPGSTNDKIEAICTKDGKNARKSIQVQSSAKISGWYVEANETEATVYAVVAVREGGGESSPLDTGNVSQPVQSQNYAECLSTWNTPYGGLRYYRNAVDAQGGKFIPYGMSKVLIARGSSGNAKISYSSQLNSPPDYAWSDIALNATYTYDGKTVYYVGWTSPNGWHIPSDTIISDSFISTYDSLSSLTHPGQVAWTIIYGTPSGEYGESKEIIVGRFAIDLEDAGGDGPGSGWINPGDYDPDWEEGDPTHTLYVTVTGALSGRHNDPIEDPSYSYIPADKDTVKDYGCGGDGGHGGGGGAGASTVVIHKFATNQANSKEVTAIARRHGYGSGGGKGGKGGDGCILVYY